VERQLQLVRLLADGHFHSGSNLGGKLGIGRGAVWRRVQSLEALGLEVFSVPGKGYRLARPLELLLSERIRAELTAASASLLSGLEVLPELDSTNEYLLQQARGGLASGYACFAEYQSAGRGRRGRNWVSPFGASIYFSVFRRFEVEPETLQGLSLAVGVGLAAALQSLGVEEVGLKWPNDLVCDGRKLGGILIELFGEPAGPWGVVVGIGVNVSLPRTCATQIDQPWVDLDSVLEGTAARNRIAGQSLHHLLLALERFSAEGFAPFRQEWQRRDVVRDRSVVLTAERQVTHGRACGVDETGALLLSVDGRVQRFLTGDLSLRVVP
jgi:BirA family biotin operon repressor/biotin-[acetyl-CoA-carboxylase] ligase